MLLLLGSMVLDYNLHSGEIVDCIYLFPILVAAFLLQPIEVAIVVSLSSIMELISEAPAFDKPSENLSSFGIIAAAGLLIAVIAFLFRRYVNPLKTADMALEVSPVAYAEFRYPRCTLAKSNTGFDKMTMQPEGTTATAGSTVFDFFEKRAAERLVALMQESVTAGRVTECTQFAVRQGERRSSSFW